jgi:hypothetical protein
MPGQLAIAGSLLVMASMLAPLASAGEPLRRMTHSQYNNAVRDLLRDQTQPADRFPPEDFIHGFKNQIQGQGVSPLLAEAYSASAERLARNAFRGGDPNQLVPCEPKGAGDEACAAKFVRQFGRRAYRRPLTDVEAKRLVALWRQEASGSKDFYTGAQAALEAMLQSPHFLYRNERAGEPYGIASQLAFFLWDTIPDEALLQAAASGELKTEQGIAKVARRMAGDDRARESLDEFLSQWLRFDLLLGTVKDRRLYSQFTPELAVAMAEETRRLVHHLVWGDRSFLEIFTSDYAFVNSELAQIYGLPAPPAEFAKVSFPAESDRAGLLGQGTFLALTGKPGDTSPTARGLFVRERLLCQVIPDPPPGTNANLPLVTADKPRSNRERLSEHVSNPACAGCHQMIDPIGFAFERFDTIGQRREKLLLKFMPQFGKDNKSPTPTTAEVELDTRGRIIGVPGSEFSNPRELGKLLADNAKCQECVVRQLYRYASGRKEESGDNEAIARIADVFRKSQFRFREIMVATAVELTRP